MSFPGFDQAVTNNGYAWWYIDGVSDDGRHAVTVIAFIGNVFSPYYHHARRFAGAGGVPAANHCAVNVALYGPTRRWSMTEHGSANLAVTPDRYTLAANTLTWDGEKLVIKLDCRGALIPRRIRGRIVVEPIAMTPTPRALDHAGHHQWHPVAPDSRVKLDLSEPGLSWRGRGYLDHNRGSRALESDFIDWEWSRVNTGVASAIHYDTREVGGQERHYALRIDSAGHVTHVDAADWQRLPSTPIWRMPRHARSERRASTAVRHTLEDTPFYSRSAIVTQIDGRESHGVHESLSLARFENPLVRYLLRCKMPRQSRRKA